MKTSIRSTICFLLIIAALLNVKQVLGQQIVKLSDDDRVKGLIKELSISQEKAVALLKIFKHHDQQAEVLLQNKELNKEQKWQGYQALSRERQLSVSGILNNQEFARLKQAMERHSKERLAMRLAEQQDLKEPRKP